MYSNVVTAIDKILRSYYVSTVSPHTWTVLDTSDHGSFPCFQCQILIPPSLGIGMLILLLSIHPLNLPTLPNPSWRVDRSLFPHPLHYPTILSLLG